MEAKFKIGDIVLHKASGKAAVVSGYRHGCSVHGSHAGCMGLTSDKRPCKWGFVGWYEVETDFDGKTITIHEKLLKQ